MHVRHDPDDGDGARTLATTVETAESFLSQARGLMFRTSIPDDYALVFPFGDPEVRDAHMVCVPFDIDAIWVVDEEVQHVETMAAWTGRASADCDTLIELPAGAASGVGVGDRVRVTEESA
ncbi:DUF192 domain-containing protein [Halobacterium salinarum]|uniref:DUF192 family protein n=5 Tax=Halobacterium salinarum TaxID=2242 RepID=A0A510N480_HALSA|nr:DUF192 domain-containing protein [Halobacterium salinarum]MBB6090669.1 hypothetical protein [Halobacterium salinarum]MCF2207153.1 DUF192 domain-containing protein [Halobacterium salinarum]MCF2237913.1 DUF192 domain-containing protein [Halobacterium salinarum]MCF2240527.1 DUF192 domain-containing protein [Halobacterium salinarum]MDL0120197.1 DUF192 domain-containing protein [Halobacterium salinarum]